MNCEGAYATAQEFSEFWSISCMDNDQEMALDRMLKMMAGNIHAVRAATGACDCELSPWALDMLKQINIIMVAVTYRNVCGLQLDLDNRKVYLSWVNNQLTAIRQGYIELCADATGLDAPAIGIAQHGTTEWNIDRLIGRTRK